MKKLLAALLVLSMILSFSACCFTKEDNNEISFDHVEDTSKEESQKTDATVSQPVSSENSEEISNDESSEPSNETSNETSSDENEEKKVSRGVLNGNVYHSYFSGLTFRKPDDWAFASDDVIAQMINVGAEMLDQSQFEQTMAQLASVYDMMAANQTNTKNVIVVYENLEYSNSTSINESDYLVAVKNGLDNQTVADYTTDSTGTVTIGGNTYYKMSLTADYSGTLVYQSYTVRKIGKYMTAIICTAGSKEELSEVENLFS